MTRISDVMPESKYDIDSDTGLPVLPEGQRWYVGEHGYPYRGTFGIGIQRFSPEKTTEKMRELLAFLILAVTGALVIGLLIVAVAHIGWPILAVIGFFIGLWLVNWALDVVEAMR